MALIILFFPLKKTWTIFTGMQLILLRIYLFTVKWLLLTEVASMWDVTENFIGKKLIYQYTYIRRLLFSTFYNICQVKQKPNKSANYFNCLGTLFSTIMRLPILLSSKERSKQPTKTNSSWRKLKTGIKNRFKYTEDDSVSIKKANKQEVVEIIKQQKDWME